MIVLIVLVVFLALAYCMYAQMTGKCACFSYLKRRAEEEKALQELKEMTEMVEMLEAKKKQRVGTGDIEEAKEETTQ